MYYSNEKTETSWQLDTEGQKMVEFYMAWSSIVLTAFVAILSLCTNYKVKFYYLFN